MTQRTANWIWSNTQDFTVHVRVDNGLRSRGYQAARCQRPRCITAAGWTRPVTVEPIGRALNERIGRAYRQKDTARWYLRSMTSASVRSVTVRALRKDQGRSVRSRAPVAFMLTARR